MKAIRTSEFENIGRLYWVSGGRMVAVTAIASGTEAANHFCQDNERQSVLTQTPNCELVLIADIDDKGHRIALGGR